MKISKNNYYCITLIIFIVIVLLVIAYSENIIKVVQENFDEAPLGEDHTDRDSTTYQIYDNEDKHTDDSKTNHKYQKPEIFIRNDWKNPNIEPKECLHIDMLKNNKVLADKWGNGNDEFVKFSDDKPSKVNPCTRCGAGSFLDTYKRTCTACPPGTYSDKYNSLKCKACPEGKITTNEGQTSCITEDDYDLTVEEMEDNAEIIRAYNSLKGKYKKLTNNYSDHLNKQKDPLLCEVVSNHHEKQLSKIQEIKETNDKIKKLKSQVDDYMMTLEDVKSFDSDGKMSYYQDASN